MVTMGDQYLGLIVPNVHEGRPVFGANNSLFLMGDQDLRLIVLYVHDERHKLATNSSKF